MKTVLTFATGSTLLYFAQPAANDALVATLFLWSLATARPLAIAFRVALSEGLLAQPA